MIDIHFIRHGLTDAVGVRLAGRKAGEHLNEAGKEQVQRACRFFLNKPPDLIFSSPLERAMETAAILADAIHVAVQSSDAFNEIDYGDWTNACIDDLTGNEHFQRFNQYRSTTRIPGGETMREAQERMIAGVEELTSKYPDRHIVVVSHSDMIKSTIAWYAGIPLDLMQRIEIAPASVSTLSFSDGEIHLQRVNCTAPF